MDGRRGCTMRGGGGGEGGGGEGGGGGGSGGGGGGGETETDIERERERHTHRDTEIERKNMIEMRNRESLQVHTAQGSQHHLVSHCRCTDFCLHPTIGAYWFGRHRDLLVTSCRASRRRGSQQSSCRVVHADRRATSQVCSEPKIGDAEEACQIGNAERTRPETSRLRPS